MYDRKVRAVLEQAGWYEGRKIDISEKVTKLEECGIEVFDKAKEFFQEFDGLHLPQYNHKDRYHEFDITFTIELVLKQPKEERKKWYGHLCNNDFSEERNIKIGTMAGYQMYLYITESGKIINDLSVIGNTIEEGIENLVKDRTSNGLKRWLIKERNDIKSVGEYHIVNENTLYEYVGSDIDIIIPNYIQKIGAAAFFENNNIKSVTISNTVIELGVDCFCRCINLESVDIPESVEVMRGDVFCGCYKLKNIQLSCNITRLSQNTFLNCINLESVIIPDAVVEICEQAFCNCRSLKKIDIPQNVKKIWAFAFEKCTGLKTISFHNGLKEILPFAFYNCKSLENIILPDSIESVGECAFDECDNLKTISIPETLKDIRKDAFGNARIILRRTAK